MLIVCIIILSIFILNLFITLLILRELKRENKVKAEEVEKYSYNTKLDNEEKDTLLKSMTELVTDKSTYFIYKTEEGGDK